MKYIKNFNDLNEKLKSGCIEEITLHLNNETEELDVEDFFIKFLDDEQRNDIRKLFGNNIIYYFEEVDGVSDEDTEFKDINVKFDAFAHGKYYDCGDEEGPYTEFGNVEDVTITHDIDFSFLSDEERKEKQDLIKKFNEYLELYYFEKLDVNSGKYDWVEEFDDGYDG